MRQKITLLILAALMVTAGSFAKSSTDDKVLSKQKAVSLFKVAGKNAAMKQESETMPQRQLDLNRQKAVRAAMSSHSKAKASTTAKKRVQRRADIINEQPEGRQVLYNRSGTAYYATIFGTLGQTNLSGAIGNVVFANDNTVYIKDLVSQAGAGVWAKGTLSGSTITFELPQLAIDYSEYGYNLVMAKLSYDNAQQWYFKSADQKLVLNYDAETGTISCNDKMKNGQEIIGLIYDDDDSWSGYADYAISFETMTDKPAEAPEGLETETYAFTADGYEGSLVQVGFQGNEVYVQGIDKNLPENWVKGTIDGNKVVFEKGQYVGADEVAGYHQYLVSATAEEVFDPDYNQYYTEYTLADTNIEFTYDATAKTLTESTTFLLNAGTEDVNYLYAFDKAQIVPFTETAATPAAPVINELYEAGWDYYNSEYGWGYIDFNLNTMDVNGNFILPEKLSYAIWVRVNGEEKQLNFTPWDYTKLTEEMNEFPYGFTENWDFYVTGAENQVYYHVIGPEAFGVQAIYRGADEEHRSEIAWVEVTGMGADVQPAAATPDYPDVTLSDTDNRIGYGYYTGSEEIGSTTNYNKPETYDVAIKLSDPALEGTIIESITFPLMEVGGVKDINVFVTSQLRIENGKNVPDLAVKSVTPTEAGFITVKLDKPYLIPEGGVYVGYSLTVTDVDEFVLNKKPIANIANTTEGGFYLHTSDGFLKWLDVSDQLGNAVVTVTVAGNAIKNNSAGVADGTQRYVMTGEAFTVPVTVSNYGANGIQSVDIAYSVAGQQGTQHFDTAVDAFFGKTAQVELNIPAIAEKGNYDLNVTVQKVNGVANEKTDATATTPVVALNTIPKHRVLLEEYTGLWCGWCPRGYVGLEKLAELYPDDYVLVSYHNADDMEILSSNNFPSVVTGFPAAWMERRTEVDAYYGTGNKDFGIADDMSAQAKEFGIANIDISTKLTAGITLSVATEVTFPFNIVDGTYALEYILVSDSLKNDAWGQSNYYASGSQGNPLYMDTFSMTSDSEVFGLTFNDVAVKTSKIGGIANSIPANVNADEPVKHNYNFNLNLVKNTNGQSIIQNKKNLKVVVLLIDQATGNVVNANKVKVGENTGIEELADSRDGQVMYYDLSGRRVVNPAKGMFIKTVRSNGITTSKKVMVK